MITNILNVKIQQTTTKTKNTFRITFADKKNINNKLIWIVITMGFDPQFVIS